MIIKTKQELKDILKYEKNLYLGPTAKSRIKDRLVKYNMWMIFHFIKRLRKTEYYFYKKNNSILYEIMYLLAERQKNIMGMKLGLEIGKNSCGKGILIWHFGDIVINGDARLGENCILHGNNCIGNDGVIGNNPIIGDNVEIGVGAKILGNVEIANNITIGAGAVVVDSFLEPGSVIAGVPARIVNNN